jgi:DNA-binding NarL/FixJ family response regulator
VFELKRDVVRLLARALSNQQIAAELNIRVATARTHSDDNRRPPARAA